jgi:hypothetical protein
VLTEDETGRVKEYFITEKIPEGSAKTESQKPITITAFSTNQEFIKLLRYTYT